MYAWIVRSLIGRAIEHLNAGNIRPLLRSYAPDASMVFPGQHTWAGDYRGRAEIERFLRRVVRVGLQFEPIEIIVKGPPWRTTVCVRFRNKASAHDGTVVYANRGLIYVQAIWGRIVFEEVYEDTQKVAEFDEYLATHSIGA